MRLEPKPAAVLAAASFALLLIFGAAWPGPGIWLLAAALGCLAAAVAAWWIDTAPAQNRTSAQRVAQTPFGAAAPGLASARSDRGNRQGWPDRVHLAWVVGASGLLALILFIGGALGGGEDETPAQVALEANPRVIDLSRDNSPSAALPTPAEPTQPINQANQTPTPVSAPTPAPTVAPPAAVKPIVVADPRPATPVEVQSRENDAAAVTPAARTIEHTIVEGDTLYGLAIEYDTTVEAIETLNGINAATTTLHLGDILLIPQPDE